MKKKNISIIFIILSSVLFIGASDSCLERWSDFSYTAEKAKLTEWMRKSSRNILNKNKNIVDFDVLLPAVPECTGLFITLIRKGKVRGCYGAFNHSSISPSEIFREYLKGSIFFDLRHVPLEKSELDETEIVLTVTSNPEPVDDINDIDISNFGVFIECEDSSKTVIVPAEYRTTSRVMKLTGNGRCRFYKFRAVTIR